MIIEAAAPVRIDLAGGTLDLYPLYLLLEGAVTVNVAINLTTSVRLVPRRDDEIHIRSEDSGKSVKAKSVKELPIDGPLGILCRGVKYFHTEGGLDVITDTKIPQGSGLGTSSSLLAVLGVALCRYNNVRMPREALVARISELEAQAIGVPTGKQDYYAALCGGVNAIHFRVAENRVEKLTGEPGLIPTLERHFILSYTGESRQSAIANWNMLKGFIEDTGDSRKRMREIQSIAQEMREAILTNNMAAVGELLEREWDCRKGLAKGISTPKIDKLMSAAKKAGATASKICGAGGGGCMITMAAPERREEVVKALEKAGAKEMPWSINRQGLTLRLA